MNAYDCIVVLGAQPDPESWELPRYAQNSLDRAAQLLRQGAVDRVALSGGSSLQFMWSGVEPPFNECDKMEEYIVGIGVDTSAILKESKSKDTVSNLYYLKKLVFVPNGIKRVLLLTPEFHVKRLTFLCQKIWGLDYTVNFEVVDCPPEEINSSEAVLLKKWQEFLRDMPNGDGAWLDDKFFDNPMYNYWKQRYLHGI